MRDHANNPIGPLGFSSIITENMVNMRQVLNQISLRLTKPVYDKVVQSIPTIAETAPKGNLDEARVILLAIHSITSSNKFAPDKRETVDMLTDLLIELKDPARYGPSHGFKDLYPVVAARVAVAAQLLFVETGDLMVVQRFVDVSKQVLESDRSIPTLGNPAKFYYPELLQKVLLVSTENPALASKIARESFRMTTREMGAYTEVKRE